MEASVRQPDRSPLNAALIKRKNILFQLRIKEDAHYLSGHGLQKSKSHLHGVKDNTVRSRCGFNKAI
jgi:hypothetical protein